MQSREPHHCVCGDRVSLLSSLFIILCLSLRCTAIDAAVQREKVSTPKALCTRMEGEGDQWQDTQSWSSVKVMGRLHWVAWVPGASERSTGMIASSGPASVPWAWAPGRGTFLPWGSRTLFPSHHYRWSLFMQMHRICCSSSLPSHSFCTLGCAEYSGAHPPNCFFGEKRRRLVHQNEREARTRKGLINHL
jgi:hypothetical protein